MKILVTDLPIVGKYRIIDHETGKILEQYDGKGPSENSFDVSFRSVRSVYGQDDYIIVEV